MTGRVIVVTGANSGIGFETARYLCEGGNDVILACRSDGSGENAVQRIRDENPYALATYMKLDLASRDSIETFVDRFHDSGKKLHVLICNAGIMGPKERQSSQDGLEIVMATNYFGHFLLTHLLLEDLKKTGANSHDSRIVLITSRIHDPEKVLNRRLAVAPLDMDNLLLHEDGSYSGLQAYKNSKAALVMMGYHLSALLAGTGVTVNSVCPGFTPTTNLNREGSKPQKAFAKWFVHRALRFMHLSQTVHKAAKSVVNLACNDDLCGVSGKYFMELSESTSSAETQEKELQQELYNITGGMLQLAGFEPIKIPQLEPKAVDQETQVTSRHDTDNLQQATSTDPAPMTVELTVEKADTGSQYEESGVAVEGATVVEPVEVDDSLLVEPGDLSNLDMTFDESKLLTDDSMLDQSHTVEP